MEQTGSGVAMGRLKTAMSFGERLACMVTLAGVLADCAAEEVEDGIGELRTLEEAVNRALRAPADA